tara:strand:- start:145 stop:537 length:393 start_codon:yes stop_codon:yes gene_type:complete
MSRARLVATFEEIQRTRDIIRIFKRKPPDAFIVPEWWLRGLPEMEFSLLRDCKTEFIYKVKIIKPEVEFHFLYYWREEEERTWRVNKENNLPDRCRWTDTEVNGRQVGDPHIRRVLQELGFNTAETFDNL